ncbi:MAG: hypothetical protein HY928_06325 [Elusimicrobia bacterium]|nr:hypothetical protein [Elusimicrobiota bacterium]
MTRKTLYALSAALLALSAAAQDGTFPQPAGWGNLRPHDGAGISPGTGGAADVDKQPTYVPPGASTQKNIQTNQPAAADDSDGEGEEKKSNPADALKGLQPPQGGDKKGGGDGAKGGGGGCKGSSSDLDAAKKAVEDDLKNARPDDKKTQQLINDARDTVLNANIAQTKLNKATLDELKQARDSLDSAADAIKEQNTQNKTAIDKLQQNQTARDPVVQKAEIGSLAKAPACTGDANASTVSDGGTGPVDSAKDSTKKGKSLQDTAAKGIESVLPVVKAIGSVVAPMTTAAASSLANLGSGMSAASAVAHLTTLRDKAEKYLSDAKSTSKTANDAVIATQTAQDSSQTTAKHLTTAVTQDAKTTKAVKDGCEDIKKAETAWNAADKLDEPAKKTGKLDAIADATKAKTSMSEAQTKMGEEITKLNSEQRQAESDQRASKSAIKALSRKLGV